MPFLDHVEELRWRILKSLVAVLLASLVGWVIVEHVDVIRMLMRPIIPLLPDGKLKFTSPTEPFLITLKFAFALGLVIASPVVIYQVWAFLTPALYNREKRLIVPALSVGVVLFLTGAAVAYEWLLPRVLRMLFSFQPQVFSPIITADGYFSFAAQFLIAIGLAMELPLVVVILTALRLVTPQFLARNRRYALAVSAVAAALLAPPDALSMLVGIVLLMVLYEVSIWCAWVVTKRRDRRERAGRASAAGLVALLLAAAGSLDAQTPRRPPPRPPRPDTTARSAADSAAQGRLDTATARRLGLPTGPTRSFPPSDPVIDSLLKLRGYRITQYVADTLIAQGGDTDRSVVPPVGMTADDVVAALPAGPDVAELVDECYFRNGHAILFPNYFLDRIAKTYHHGGLDFGRESKIPSHCFFLDSRIDSGDHSVVPRRQLHLLDRASCVDEVEPQFGVCQDDNRKVSAGDPRTTRTILRQLLYRFLVLDEYESQVLLVISRSRGSRRFKDLHLHIGRDLLRAVLSNVQFSQNCLMGIHFSQSVSENRPKLKNVSLNAQIE